MRYNRILRKYGNDAKIFFTATNSLCYKSHTKDVLEIYKKNDSGWFLENSKYFDETN